MFYVKTSLFNEFITVKARKYSVGLILQLLHALLFYNSIAILNTNSELLEFIILGKSYCDTFQ